MGNILFTPNVFFPKGAIKMKHPSYKLLIIISAMLIMLAGCAPASIPATAIPPTKIVVPPTTTSVPLGQQVTLVSTDLKESQTTSPMYEITGQTPMLQGSDDPRVTAFNTSMQKLTQAEVDAFKQGMKNITVIPEVPNSSFNFQYSLVSPAGSKINSIKFSFEGFTSGAAHPYHYTKTVNYNLESGQELTLDQLFVPGTDYLQTISDNCKTELSKRDIGFAGDFTTGADAKPENYQNWNIAADGLLITFDEYQVAPYAAGPQAVLIPYSALTNLADPAGPLQ
jgi:hypothetical protein